jgi:hypothetical protein
VGLSFFGIGSETAGITTSQPFGATEGSLIFCPEASSTTIFTLSISCKKVIELDDPDVNVII